jgi:hypothetical protein
MMTKPNFGPTIIQPVLNNAKLELAFRDAA